MPMQNMDLMRLLDDFHSEEACREVLAELRWPNGVACPRCGALGNAYDSKRYVWDCYSCGYQFSVLAGTVLHDTKLPLRKWFMAVLLMVEAKKGISANQMKRTIGVSYKTAWYLCHRIRAAMAEVSPEPLSGVVEIDETYIGGKKRGKRRGVGQAHGFRDKTMVVGALERGGEIRLKIERKADRKTLHGFIKSVVDDDATHIFTDEWAGYGGIGDANTTHDTVSHRQEEWVRGDVHTQGIESAWSLLKRSIVGSYHQLSTKHLEAYLDEMSFRFNNRENPYLFRDTLIALLKTETLPYQELIAEKD